MRTNRRLSPVETFETFCREQERRLLYHFYDPNSLRYTHRVLGAHGPVPAEHIEAHEARDYVQAKRRYSVLGPQLERGERKNLHTLECEVKR